MKGELYMKQSYLVNPIKCFIASLTALTFLILSVTMVALVRPFSSAVFAALSIIFIAVALQNGSRIYINEQGVQKFLLGRKIRGFMWEEISELGICGTKVFHKNHPERAGTLYIYASKQALSDEERFHMILKWPPKNQIYMTYTPQKLQMMQLLSCQKIHMYNTGDLTL